MLVTLYAAILALLYVFLSFRVINARRTYRVSLGDNNQAAVTKVVRVHGNFAEYVPFALLLIFFVENSGWQPLYVHLLGVALVVGRILHAYGVGKAKPSLNLRIAGMALTLLVLLLSALLLLIVRVM